jgi:Immunity protein 53
LADELSWLQSFYLSLCDEDWEHSFGCKIDTLDNPGWTFEFELNDTAFETVQLGSVLDNRSEHDWVHFRKEGAKFSGACGPQNLAELIGKFKNFIETETADQSIAGMSNAPNK